MKYTIKEKSGMVILFLIAILYKIIAFLVSNKSIFLMIILISLAIITRKSIMILLFLYSVLPFIVNKVLYKEINDYIIINRFTGNIYMNAKLGKKHFKTSSNIVLLRKLCKGFEAGLMLIPDKIKNNIFLKRKETFTVKTHEAIFAVINQKYNINQNSYEIIKKGIVTEKLFLYKMRDIFDYNKYKKLIAKSNKYKIIINIKDIREILSCSK